MYDFPFHMLFLIFSFFITSYRSYYTGYAYANGEVVSREEEGRLIRRLRFGFGFPFILGCWVYLLNPAWMQWSSLSDLPVFLRWVGIVLLFIALALYRWTHANLDKNFTDTVFIRHHSTLVNSGPYRWVRHPMYVCALLMAVGTGLGLANWFLGMCGTIVVTVIMIMRTPIEEGKLLTKHGDAYKRYMKETGKFFPKIYF